MRQRTARRVLESYQADPRVPVRELARRLDVTPKAVRWHVKRFRADGLLEPRGVPPDREDGDGKLAVVVDVAPWDAADHPEHG